MDMSGLFNELSTALTICRLTATIWVVPHS